MSTHGRSVQPPPAKPRDRLRAWLKAGELAVRAAALILVATLAWHAVDVLGRHSVELVLRPAPGAMEIRPGKLYRT